MDNSTQFWLENLKGWDPQEDNIKMNIPEIGYESAESNG